MSRVPGSPKTGGRVKGSLDRQARALITNEMAHDVLLTYRALGGVTGFLIPWAKANPGLFVQQCLSRLMPAPPKEDPDAVNNTQINIGSMSDFEAGRRIAFALAKAMHQQQKEQQTIEAEKDEPDA